MFLETIHKPSDVKKLTYTQLDILCREIRQFLLQVLSQTGGHLASNLGVVELTVALHKVFDSPTDQIVWDVGHQSYVHKILTGRKERFPTVRQEGGLSGFPKTAESVHDAFLSGHSGNSISAAYGLLWGKKLSGEKGDVIAVIGDGSLSNGMAYEGMNHAGRGNGKLIVILNDNEMSISQNVGALAEHLAKIRTRPFYFQFKDALEQTLVGIPLVGRPVRNLLSDVKRGVKQTLYPSNFFEDLGFSYMGPVDGHDLRQLTDVLNRAKKLNGSVFIHVKTQKGKGYPPAERSPQLYHGVGAFDIQSGKPVPSDKESYATHFGQYLTSLARQDRRICAITAAMADGTGLEAFAEEFAAEGRFFDVGIAEAHGVTFAAGLAAKGMLPVFAVYSTFLQRGIDQVLHDAAIEKRHIVLAVDRAGIVGSDGETHQGIYDVALLSPIPGITIYSPSSFAELESTLNKALYRHDGPVVVRYPRGGECGVPEYGIDPTLDYQLYEKPDATCLLVSYGREFAQVATAAKELSLQGNSASVLKLGQICPIPQKAIDAAMQYEKIFFFEEGAAVGSVAQQFSAALVQRGFAGIVSVHAIQDNFVPHMSPHRAYELLGLDAASIMSTVLGE